MTYSLDPLPLPHDPVALERLHHRWGWIVLFGAVVAILGVAALVGVVMATIVSVTIIALFMIIAGGGEIAMGIASRDWGHFFLWIIAGLFYIVAGAFALAQPFVAAAVFTLALGIAMMATGLLRIYFGAHLAAGLRVLVILAGVASVLVGLMIVLEWPNNSFFILGILLGLDLLFWGTGWIVFGLRLRKAV